MRVDVGDLAVERGILVADGGDELPPERRAAARDRERRVLRGVRARVERLRGHDAVAWHLLDLLGERHAATARLREPAAELFVARAVELLHADHEVVLQRECRHEERRVDPAASSGPLAPV